MEKVDKIHLLELISGAIDDFPIDHTDGRCHKCDAKRPFLPMSFQLEPRRVAIPNPQSNKQIHGLSELYCKISGWMWIGKNWVEFLVYNDRQLPSRILWCPSCAGGELGPDITWKE